MMNRVGSKGTRKFGEGLLASRPVHRSPASFEDMAWWTAQEADRENRELDQLWGEFRAMACLENGGVI
jgi:hypothetical protein